MSPKHRRQKEEAIAKCRQVMRLQHKAWTTEGSYISAIGSYISWLCEWGHRWPDSRSRMEVYLTIQADQRNGLPVQLPDRLDRKSKNAAFAWQWAFVFPAHRPCPHPRTRDIVRFRMHECNVQRAFQASAKVLGLEGVATPHVMRHCYATHVLEAGASIRDVQEQLGHAHLDTTMIYAHGDGERVRSPLEVL